MKKNIFIILTPYHVLQIETLMQKFPLSRKGAYIFYDQNILSLNRIAEIFANDAILIPIMFKEKLSFRGLMKGKISELLKFKKQVQIFKTQASELINTSSDSYNMLIGTDKDLFTQIVINTLDRKGLLKVLSAFEEGNGYYVNETRKDRFLKILYKILTPFFGFKYRYIKTLGTHDRLDKIYVRRIEAIRRKPSIEYIEIPLDKLENKKVNKGKVLLLTSPFSEQHKMTIQEELNMYKRILLQFGKGLKAYIKPHPRENDNKYDDIPTLVLDKSMSAEEINYFEFERIIHFGSSALIDIDANNYELKNVYTVISKDRLSSIRLKSLIEKTNVIYK